jgi:hydrogenase/urease accessory protein HupE
MTATPTRRSPLLPLAILAVLLAVGFTISDAGVQWFWAEVPWFAVLLAMVGILLGVLHFTRRVPAKS